MNAKAYFELAEKKFNEGQFKESIKLYSKAIDLEGDNAHYISQRGVSFFRMGKHEEALYDLDLALKIEPENPYRYSSRAFVLSNLNRIDEALSDYQKAIQLDPQDAIAHNNLGLLQEKKGYHSKAKTNFDKADELEGLNSKKEMDQVISEETKPEGGRVISDFNYKEIGYWQFIKLVFTNEVVRKDFLSFLRNGFKIKK